MVEIKLVGGPNDGAKMSIDCHRDRWLMPRPYHHPIGSPESIMTEAAAMYVSVYKRVGSTDTYRFVGVDRR